MHELYQPISKTVSSYKENELGETLFLLVLSLKPKKIIEFGTLDGYSALSMAQALKIIGEGHITCYDLFEKYEYRHTPKEEVEKNIEEYKDFITLKELDWNDWKGETFDLMHFDISNDGHTIRDVYRRTKKQRKKGALVVFEGGSQERDDVEWMKKYNKMPIRECGVPFKVIDDRFPSMSVL